MANELILAVDDEAHILELLSFNLEASGYRVVTAATGEDALVVCAHERPAMVLLDIMLPGIDGIEVCRRLKSAPTTADIPIIMLTAKGDERDELLGFELGVDEYITKPFSPSILVARVEAILRRSGVVDNGELLKAGDIEIDKAAHQVRIDGKLVELSFKEFELLTYFVENQGIALSREKILNSVWNYDYYGDARTIDTHVKKLRAKMGDRGSCIKTIWGMGYKFEAEPEESGGKNGSSGKS